MTSLLPRPTPLHATKPMGHRFKAFRRVVTHFFEHSKETAPDFTRATNIGYLVGTNVTRALVYRAYRPATYWVRVEVNPHTYRTAMNPVREADVPRVLEALNFKGESRWIPSAANTAFGMPTEWRLQFSTMGGGGDHLYFIRFGEVVQMLTPMVCQKAFKRENRIKGLNEFLGVLPYTPERRERVMAKLSPWSTTDGQGYKMVKPLLRRLGWWCSKQVLKDLGLEPTE